MKRTQNKINYNHKIETKIYILSLVGNKHTHYLSFYELKWKRSGRLGVREGKECKDLGLCAFSG